MRSLLLSAALAWPVTFPGGQTITVPLPHHGPTDLYQHSAPDTFFNPQRSHAVIRRCWSAGVNTDRCELVLAHPRLGARPLPQGDVRGLPGLVWTPDGRYLIAYGDTWLRLWNLNGRVRGLTPSIQPEPTEQILGRSIEELDLSGQLLCVRTRFTVGVPEYPTPGPEASPEGTSREVRVRQAYRWPGLQRASRADDRRC